MKGARLVVAALALALATQASAGAVPSRARHAAIGGAHHVVKKLRADKGQIRPDRVPARAKVAIADHRPSSKPGRRRDPGPHSLSEQTAQGIEELLRGPLREGTTSLYVADAATGKPVFSVYPDDPLNPASNVKLIATATALDLLGPDYRYHTRVLGESADDAGVIHHDLYLLGSYDATLSRAALAELAGDLASQGVHELDGDVVVGGAPARDGMWRSFYDLTIVAGEPGTAPTVTMDPQTDFVQIVNTATTSKKKRVRHGIEVDDKMVTDATGHPHLQITVSGTIGKGKTALRDVWMKERALHTAYVLRASLAAAGITVKGDVHVAELRDYLDTSLGQGFLPVPLAEHLSQRLADLVQRVNKHSTNWLADRLVETAAARRFGGKPEMGKAVDAMYAWLDKHAGLARKDLVVDTGSGLSYKTEISARQIVTVLRAGLGLDKPPSTPRDAAIEQAYFASLAIGGVDGTIRHRFKTIPATIRGKTGTLERVVSLSGLIQVAPDREFVFSIITNGHDPVYKTRIRGGQEKIVGLLCDYLHRMPAPATAPTPVAVAPTAPATTPTAPTADEPTVDDADEDEGDDAPATRTTSSPSTETSPDLAP